ncbi:unnamed protein product [Spirodela intermedia]|uniref:Ribonuclease H2 subunit B n=1 Tax=Spirodela intermedia TaxID=51605 RepID=A0A7I8KT35_SPIIN|nr:unnamed protein product [Spirodela intermedia]
MAWHDGVRETRVLIGPCNKNDEGECGKAEGRILSLRHPKSGTPTCYIFGNESLQELHWFKQAYGSWFIGDYVSEDASLFISTPFDPIFLFLPVFEEARMKKSHDQGMFRELNEILFVDGYPGYQHLLSIAKDSIELICEVKEIGASKFFRLDDSKVLAWLCCKISNLKATLLTLDRNFAAREEAETLNDAVSLLGEYINDAWLKTLCDHMNRGETPPTFSPTSRGSRNGNGKRASEKPSKKKPTDQVESKNIRDMFMRATRSGSKIAKR